MIVKELLMYDIYLKITNKKGNKYSVKTTMELPSDSLNNNTKDIIDEWIECNLKDVAFYDVILSKTDMSLNERIGG